jgi:predicted transcriptional regulator
VFDDAERAEMLGRLNATLRHTLAAGPPRDGSGDNMLIALSAGGIAFMAGRGAMLGVSVFAAGGLLVPVAGIGLGLAAGGYVLWRRRVQTDRQQARIWLRDVLGEARAALTDEIANRFTDLQYALSVAVDDAIERRLKDLDAHIAEIDAALAEDAAGRAKRRAAAIAERDAVATRLRQADEALLHARALTPTPIDDDRERLA